MEGLWFGLCCTFGSIILALLGWMGIVLVGILKEYKDQIAKQGTEIAVHAKVLQDHDKAIDDLEKNVYTINYNKRR